MPEPAADSDAAILPLFADIAQAAESQRRELLHRLVIVLCHRKDRWIGRLEGLRPPVIGSAGTEAVDRLAEGGQLFLDFGRRRVECHVTQQYSEKERRVTRMMTLLLIVASTLVGIAGFAGLLHLIPRLGAAGTRIGAWLWRAPGLDLVVSLVTWIPPTVLGIVLGWRGVVGSIIGQVLGMLVWMFAHELANRKYVNGPRIVTFLNRTVGRFNNHIALWVTAVALPVFFVIRVAQVCVYPILTPLVGLPRYRDADWVNVSRQKFNGLVGHDLIWCLYCDWMTGVYALGAEMLRNVESFWCPIRFASGKKCDNCKLDFPDIEAGWVEPEGTMGDVVATLERMYAAPATANLPPDQRHPWFGHTVRTRAGGSC